MKKHILTILIMSLWLNSQVFAQVSEDPQAFKIFFQDYLKAYNQNPVQALKMGAVSDY